MAYTELKAINKTLFEGCSDIECEAAKRAQEKRYTFLNLRQALIKQNILDARLKIPPVL